MMNRFHTPYLTVTLTGIGLVLGGSALANPGQLTWSNKRPLPSSVSETTPAPDAQKFEKALPNAATGNEGFQIPPSPYGQVGNPYRRELNWSNKGKAPTEQVARQVPAPQPQMQSQPKLEARAEPKPEPKPEPKAVQKVEKPVELTANWTPAPTPRFEPKAPEIKPDIRLQAAPQPKVEPKVEPKIIAAPTVETVKKIDSPIPLPTPKPPVVTAEKLGTPKPEVNPQPKPATDGTYQLPANSKYAGKVAPVLEGKEVPKVVAKAEPKPDPKTVSAAQKEVAKQADAAKTVAKTDAKKAPEKDLKLAAATESEPLTQAVEQDPYVPFVPGSRATNASQTPRYYSLHRAYGYEPDPAPHAGGELALDPATVQTKDKPKTPAKDEVQKAPVPTSQDTSKK
ncbi:hypothetical protein [Asticcacaulis sp. YBE204]|uniref:hypothetical protein n=1 Tax=Asticcacaulis sp. YBE204 TaxID=1282363 RepID=UPI0003C3B4E0|nr:hypothetical protein [Asticcacaulis sp. YBE204]ESQ79536.1 hypothetical protein AEYBE204_06745 [Asticcacaulis sp. YBE204]